MAMIHVVYGSDAANFGGLLLSMRSLSAHLREPRNCTVHVIVPRADLERAERLLECFRQEEAARVRRFGLEPGVPLVRLHELQPLGLNTTGFKSWTGSMHPLVFTKFVLHEAYLPSAPRALWLDTDTLVQADVAPLYRTAMVHPVAATLDMPYVSFEFHRQHMGEPAHGMVRDWRAQTFTTGVLLYDLERWRREAFGAHLSSLAEQLSGHDGEQLPMNLLFQDRWDHLDCRWNVVQPLAYFVLAGWLTSRQCIAKAWILHATGHKRKYWQADSSMVFYDVLAPYMPTATCEAWLQSWRVPADTKGSTWHNV